ncbi:hypothetical protein HPP92_015180 [Vanilla planifolia]|uniref:Uncharacterized protein n=1 Tax=Vanilla planifolia TaxID=51239 RepID=A0A835UTT5_VANPL|nr:hypothetical protein HPP92_015180 [Vanilla planifolia]
MLEKARFPSTRPPSMEQLLQKLRLYYFLPHFSFTYFLKFALRQSCKSVTELSFPLKSTSLEDVVLATKECPKLKSVALPCLSSAEEVQISELVCKWRDVEQLKMESKPSNFPNLARNISLHCRNFRGLVVSGEITEVDALAIVCYLPMLKELDLSNSNLPKTELLTIIKGCKQLKKLNVNGCIGFEGDDKEILETASCIKEFNNEACKLYYEDAYQSGEWDSDFCLQGYVV